MQVETLLLEGFSAAVVERLTRAVKQTIQGSLDDRPFVDCTVLATGRRAFVVKGWVDRAAGPVVRFRAAWGDLAGGEVRFQELPGTAWLDAEVRGLRLDSLGHRITLVLEFVTEDGEGHGVEFTAGI